MTASLLTRGLAALLACAPWLALAAGSPAVPPAMYHGDPTGSGRVSARDADDLEAVRFAVDLGSPIRSSPIESAGVVYVGTADGRLHALDGLDGHERWRQQAGGAVMSTPAVADGRVHVVARDGLLRTLDARTGRVLWTRALGADRGTAHYWDYTLSSPIVVDGRLVLGTGSGTVLCLDARTGSVHWQHDVGARVRSTPAVRDGRVVVGTLDGHVRALRLADGADAWTFATDGASRHFEDVGNDTTAVPASPTLVGDTVVIGGRDGQLYALDLATGRQRWKITHDGSSWMLGTASDDRSVFVGGGSSSIVQAVDPATGAERWRTRTRGAVFAPPVLAGHTLLAGDFGGTLWALDAATGAPRWRFPLGGRVLASAAVAGDTVYAGSDRGVLVALALAPQAASSSISAPQAASSSISAPQAASSSIPAPQAASSPPAASSPASTARRLVAWEAPRSKQAFSWFVDGVDAALFAQLQSAGYEATDAPALAEVMRSQRADSPRTVVVFADNRVPAVLSAPGTDGAPSLLRRFLDAGGKVVFPGPDPLAYPADPVTGVVEDIDYDRPAKAFDITFPTLQDTNGYTPSQPTAAGRAAGLRHAFVGTSAVRVPQPGLQPLALDEFGLASAWLKSFGGPPGTGLLQLSLPRQELPDLAEIRAVIEQGIMW